MASVQQRRNHTLQYFDQYEYPLTKAELNFWLHTSSSNEKITFKSGFYCIAGHQKFISIRKQKELHSQNKWPIAQAVSESLKKIPTIQAIFVTGALAMNNCPVNDDIDLMIVTSPHTLWLTRILVYIVLNGHRRKPSLPEHASARVANKICDNLYLDTSHLAIKENSLYVAHEILQAKPLLDKNNIYQKFLDSNSWVKDHIPNAYNKLRSKNTFELKNRISVVAPINIVCYLIQRAYMKHKITNERISLHTAFFHPRKQV